MMDEALNKSGEWPNVALIPGTHTHAATGEHVEQPENTRIGRSRGACRPDGADCEHEPAGIENRPQDGAEWIIPINENTMRVLSDVCREQSKKQLRAEAVERVKNCRYATTVDIVREMVNWGHEPHTGDELRAALIDLLTDDDCVTVEAETSQVPEHDTREKLVADARRLAFGWSDDTEQEYRLRREVAELLNRQAAITAEETSGAWEEYRDATQREIAELTAERDNWANCYDMAVKREQNLLSKIDEVTAERDELNTRCNALETEQADLHETINRAAGKRAQVRARVHELEAEVEAQRKRANDAERGVLSEEWYVSRDRYEDDIAGLKAERDELRKERDRWRVEQVHAYGNWEDVHKYAKKLEAERDKLQERLLAALDAADAIAEEANDIKSERDRLKDVVKKQADSFAKMERELHDAKVEAKRNRDGVERLTEKCQEQREEPDVASACALAGIAEPLPLTC